MGFYHWAVTGRLDQAVRWYRRALFGEPDHPAYPTALGVIFLDLGDPDEAEYWFERPMALRPEGSWADIEMSFLHLYRGDEPTAVEQARKALTVFPDSSEALLLLRNHELSSDRYTEARALFEKSHSDLLSDGETLAAAYREFEDRTGGGLGGKNWIPPLCDYEPPIHFRWPEYVTTERGEEWWIPAMRSGAKPGAG